MSFWFLLLSSLLKAKAVLTPLTNATNSTNAMIALMVTVYGPPHKLLVARPIFKWLDFPKLETLSLNGVISWTKERLELEPKKRRTASFTTLILRSYDEQPEAMSLLIEWPATLTRFILHGFHRPILSYSKLESLLLIHKDTLKHVDIRHFSPYSEGLSLFNATLFPNLEGLSLFNATLFPNLEYLRLSHWLMDPRASIRFESQHVNLLGPRVKIFGWDVNKYNELGDIWGAFGEAEIAWIKELVKAAVARKAALQTVELEFTPGWSAEEDMVYPWDPIDRLRDEVFRPVGINLVYNEPTFSKEKWLKYVVARDKGQILTNEDEGRSESSVVSTAFDSLDEGMDSDLDPGYEGEYQGEDIRKYLVPTSRV
ncbi:hypothetical protein N0V90_000633 [Kalmusia sp. IMI 367209]|nr:hypothetical protein N0V90_000633 [Kalmusia sp. IMI 367209]